ncbi:hypothetical protein B0H14DRAFT_2575256 [Mycena olivaceomarginata]|nr:hypothetical protein B0H14DRAFT_2575256 [Mycena olivaceomarginata]
MNTAKFLQIDAFAECRYNFRAVRHLHGLDSGKLKRKSVHALSEMCVLGDGMSPRLYCTPFTSPQIYRVIENALNLATDNTRSSAQKCEAAARFFELGAYGATDFWRKRGKGHSALVGLFTAFIRAFFPNWCRESKVR